MGQRIDSFGPEGGHETGGETPPQSAEWNTGFDQPEGEEAHEDFADALNQEPQEPQGPQEQAQDDWTPPTREEWEAAQEQLSFFDQQLGPQIEQSFMQELGMLNQPQDQQQVDQQAQQMAFQPREFSPSDEMLNAILQDGDADALRGLLQEHAEVLQHNQRIEHAQATLHHLQQALPVALAVSKFYERHPELTGMRQLVETALWQARANAPQANELQILRMAEQRLKPVISKAKQIAQQHTARGGARKNLAPAPSGGGQTPPPRGRTHPGPKPEPTAEERIQQLRERSRSGLY